MNRRHFGSASRRTLLGSTAAGVLAMMAGKSSAADAPPPQKRPTVRDRLWIFTVPAGLDNSYLEMGNMRGGSRMTPAEGAFYLNIPNLILVRSNDQPTLPGNEKWRTKTTFEQYATSFRPLDRVVWSVVGSGGAGSLGELFHVLPLARKFTNIKGIYLDDLIVDRKKVDGKVVGRPALSPDQIRQARQAMAKSKTPLEIWVTLYSHELLPDHPKHIACEPPLASFLDVFDVLTLWTWNADDLRSLEKSLEALETIAPKNTRKALGLYIWDFPNHRPVPLELMKHQCETGLKWLKSGRIHEMIFLANTVLDVGLDSAEFARTWIAENGATPL